MFIHPAAAAAAAGKYAVNMTGVSSGGRNVSAAWNSDVTGKAERKVPTKMVVSRKPFLRLAHVGDV